MHESPPPAPPGSAAQPVLDFTPVPTANARHDGWTPRRQHDFIRALIAMGVVSRACKAVGLSVQSAYKLRQRDGADSFAAAWDTALEIGYSAALEMAIDRAINGVTIPRLYRGKQVGTITRPDYRLALATLSVPPKWPTPPRNKVSK